MYNVENNVTFYYCKWNYKALRWDKILKFTSEEKLIKFIAANFVKNYCLSSKLENTLFVSANYSGTDTCSIGLDHVLGFRDILFLDGQEKIVNPRVYEDKVIYEYYLQQYRHNKNSWKNNLIYRYRYDPVPGTGKRRHGGCRKEKNWFHNYKLDYIPEYEAYVRYKGRVPNVWDTEPFEGYYKSWKHNTKCKHQYEVHMNKKVS